MAGILITGGTGFAGSHLVETLLAAGTPSQDVHVTSFSARRTMVDDLLPAANIHQLNLTDTVATLALIGHLQPAQIYHLAAGAVVGSSFEKTRETLRMHLELQLNLLEAVKTAAPQARVLIVGSAMEYDCLLYQSDDPIREEHPLGPVSPYAVSKVLQDLLGLSYFYSYKLNIIRVRPFNHIGERQTPDFAIPSFAQQIVAIERGQQSELRVGNLEAVRDFSDVKDVCQAYLLLMAKGEAGEVYNVGSGQGVTMSQVLNWMCELANVTVNVVNDPSKFRPLDVPKIVADTSKIAELGWRAQTPLQDSLQRVLTYWRETSP